MCNAPETPTRCYRKRCRHLQRMSFGLPEVIKEIKHTRCTGVGSSGVDAPVVVYLGNENLISIHVQASVNVATTEFLGVWLPVCLHPTDRAWVTNQDFVLAERIGLVLSSEFRTLKQMFSRLSDICSEIQSDKGTVHDAGSHTESVLSWVARRGEIASCHRANHERRPYLHICSCSV